MSDTMAAESLQASKTVFARLADGKVPNPFVHRLLQASQQELERVRGLADAVGWQKTAASWESTVQALSMLALRLDLAGLDELTEEHHDLVMDPSRNTVFNYGVLHRLLDGYLAAHPGLRIPNKMGNILLFNARPGCRHAPDGRSSGARCKHCPGWFCF